MSNNKNTENNLSTAVETIKLLGEHVLELREVIDSQRKELAEMKAQFAKLQDAYKELDGDFNLVRIDQKDLAKQMKSMKSVVAPSPVQQEIPSYNEIVKRYYPNYSNNPEFQQSKAIKRPQQMQAKSDEMGFNFARLPKFLNLD